MWERLREYHRALREYDREASLQVFLWVVCPAIVGWLVFKGLETAAGLFGD
jgi:hypothetical protein